MKPAQAQGKKRFASLDTGSSRNVRPIRRRSRMDVPPTSKMIPKMCTVSIIGNSHSESRTDEPTAVCSSHSHIAYKKCIPGNLSISQSQSISFPLSVLFLIFPGQPCLISGCGALLLYDAFGVRGVSRRTARDAYRDSLLN